MFREDATQPNSKGVLFWMKSIYGQHCLNSKYLLGRMSQSMWKTNSINSDFIVFHFFFSLRKNNRHVPWQNSVWLLAFFKLFLFFYKYKWIYWLLYISTAHFEFTKIWMSNENMKLKKATLPKSTNLQFIPLNCLPLFDLTLKKCSK